MEISRFYFQVFVFRARFAFLESQGVVVLEISRFCFIFLFTWVHNSWNLRADFEMNFPISPSAGIPWFLSARPSVKDGVEYLGVYLYPNNIIDKDTWSIVITYEFRLLSSNSDPVGDVVKIGKDQQFKNSDSRNGWGWKFITVDELRSGSFIQEDTIKIRAHLSTKRFERIADF